MAVRKNNGKPKAVKKTSSGTGTGKKKSTGSSRKSASPENLEGRNRIIREVTGIILGLSGLFVLICILLPESTGTIGESINYAFTYWFGQASYLFPLLVLYIAVHLFFKLDRGVSHHWLMLLAAAFLFTTSTFMQLAVKDGGISGRVITRFMVNKAGLIGTYMFTVGSGMVILLLLTQFSIGRLLPGLIKAFDYVGRLLKRTYRFLTFQSDYSNLEIENHMLEKIPDLSPLEKTDKPEMTDSQNLPDETEKPDQGDSLNLLTFDEPQKTESPEDSEDDDNSGQERLGDYSIEYDNSTSNRPEDDDKKNEDSSTPKNFTVIDGKTIEIDDEQDTEEMDLPGTGAGLKKPGQPEPPDKPGSGDAKIPPLVTGTPDGKPQGYEQFSSPEQLPSEPEMPFRYEFPPLSLLKGVEKEAEEKSARDYSKLLEETLANFGVEVKVINKIRGPAVTRYELQPAKGVKVKKVTNLANDIALSLAAYSIRIEAPIPGKSAIGIEVPNHRIDPVSLRDILIEGDYRKQPPINLALGKDITGKPVMDNLLKMPHLLIAGSTGSGKSVCINCLITSILYNCSPSQIQMIMVDPKRVELSMFEGIPHLVDIKLPGGKKIITDPKAATIALKSVCDIMDQRYEDFVEMKVRNIKEYNQKAEIPLPYIITIIDELADLMMVSSATVEQFICRIAQLGRASGIHLIVATQRPSVDVITGLIKANIPSRIAFAVSSQIDSRTILDRAGAEKLLGKGDMLYLPVDANEPRRIQGAYVSSEETEKIVDFWRMQPLPENAIPIEISGDLDKRGRIVEGDSSNDSDEGRDPLIDEAIEVIRSTGQASVSNLQRKMKIGYARAGRIMDQLEKLGVVGPPDGSKPRRINLPGQKM
jgi:DNA segregation ATPase FtsK/SpoIIIE, S-DNA-T family